MGTKLASRRDAQAAGSQQYLTVAEAAERLHVSQKTIARWINAGALPRGAFKVGRGIRLRAEDVDAMIQWE